MLSIQELLDEIELLREGAKAAEATIAECKERAEAAEATIGEHLDVFAMLAREINDVPGLDTGGKSAQLQRAVCEQAERVRKALRDRVFTGISDLVDFDKATGGLTLKSPEELTPDRWAAIKRLRLVESGSGGPNRVAEIELFDKPEALRALWALYQERPDAVEG